MLSRGSKLVSLALQLNAEKKEIGSAKPLLPDGETNMIGNFYNNILPLNAENNMLPGVVYEVVLPVVEEKSDREDVEGKATHSEEIEMVRKISNDVNIQSGSGNILNMETLIADKLMRDNSDRKNDVEIVTRNDELEMDIDINMLSDNDNIPNQGVFVFLANELQLLSNSDKEPIGEMVNHEIEEDEDRSDVRMLSDTDYIPNENSSGADESDSPNSSNMPRKRKGKINRNEWKRYKNQNLRKQGKSYVGRVKNKKNEKDSDTLVSERKIGPRCATPSCLKSKKRFCDIISNDLRKELFHHFWLNLSWDERRTYIASLVDCVVPKQKRRAESGDRRGATFHYHLKVNNERKEVCRDMFCNTFGLGVWSVRSWARNVFHGMNTSNEKKGETMVVFRNVQSKAQANSLECQDLGMTTEESGGDSVEERRAFAVDFIKSLPKMESHYCRKDTSKLYLETVFKSIMDLYRVYEKICVEEKKKCLSRFTFSEILNDMNVALFQPKKDLCDVCCQYKVGNLTEVDYIKHKEGKEKARQEKEQDKKAAIMKSCQVFSVDLQAVKLAPFLRASAIYFKTKLCCHNYTVYNLASHEVDCYWWTEAEGELKASVFTSLLVCHIEEVIKKWPSDIPRVIIIWSDGCCYQNKNKVMANALLELAVKYGFVIHQKYLQVGHTQMEVDSVHARIEKTLSNREIYLPSEYVAATREARRKPSPYKAHLMTYNFFKNYDLHEGERYPTIRPGNKVADPTVNNVCNFIYMPTGVINYRLNFGDDCQPLPRRAKIIKEMVTYPSLYSSRRKIAPSKWKHLQELKAILPSDVHAFYDSLPH